MYVFCLYHLWKSFHKETKILEDFCKYLRTLDSMDLLWKIKLKYQSLNRNPNPIRINIFFSKAQKNLYCPKRNPIKTKST